MHICFITNEYPKQGFPHGGIGSFVKTLAHELVKNGNQVSIVGLNYEAKSEVETDNKVVIYRIGKSNIKGFSWFFNAKGINKKIKEIHIQSPISIIESSELGLAFLNKLQGIKYVIRLHGGHHFFAEAENRGINFWKGFQEKRSFKKADAFIAVSHYVKTHTETLLDFHNKPIAYISNPINTELFKPLAGKEKKGSIVFAGTLCEKKGIRQLIQAFAFVKKQFPEATLEIYGRDWLFPDGSSYKKMLEENELPQLGYSANDIHFHGVVGFDEIPNKYAEAAVCVFPSHMETLGLVALEAMAMEKPVIFTNKGPGPEVIIDEKTGLLCDPHNPSDIAAKIIWVLNNQEATKIMGIAAREEVLKNFGLEVLVDKNSQFYKRICS